MSAMVLPPAFGPVMSSSGRSCAELEIDRHHGPRGVVATHCASSSGWRAAAQGDRARLGDVGLDRVHALGGCGAREDPVERRR